ncbi:uncharacterized protein si:ch1073-291c23.2 [Clupea harengus]|uniref:Uncharacterized protein si:ch1073-291c23.2 n=1 Tax=Clupea harengus TaxID=7950 RepID=A0A8M1KSR5_CLUHA|nr:uncharacterized protein si:ch1073-291c23.2 [Clupea harengus]
MMSATVVTNAAPAEGVEDQEQKVVGSTKPLHRFLRGHPKYVGVVMVTLGISIFLMGFPVWLADGLSESFISFVLGVLFITCGIIFILSELNITKQLVTAGFALSIVSILGVGIGVCIYIDCLSFAVDDDYYYMEHNITGQDYTIYRNSKNQYGAVQALSMFQSVLGGAILIVMAVFARAALQSSNTKAVVVMQTRPPAD